LKETLEIMLTEEHLKSKMEEESLKESVVQLPFCTTHNKKCEQAKIPACVTGAGGVLARQRRCSEVVN